MPQKVKKTARPRPTGPPVADAAGIRILVVEDSPTQAEAIRALLAEAGYAVVLATSGEGGLAAMESLHFDVVISDVMMPGAVDGYEFCRRIKQSHHRDIPVVLLTSLSDPMDIIRGLECGADNFFTKSVDPAYLLNRLRLLLSTRESRSGSKLRMGVKVLFMGREFTITSEREQILDLLVSTFEDAVHQNRELRRREEELRLAKEALAQYAGSLERRLDSVLASVPDLLFSVDPAVTRLHYVSPACIRIFGYTPEAMTADLSLWQRAIDPEDAPRVRTFYAQTIDLRHEGVVEYRIRHRDGSVKWLQETLVPVIGDHGAVGRLDGIAHDITEHKRLEEQVRLAQKMEAVGTLAAGVAHDFNNMLAIVKGSVELVLADLDPQSPIMDDIRQIDDAVDRAAALTRQLLAFGRKQVLEPRALDLNELLGGTVRMLERIIGEDIRLVLQETSDPVIVHADPGQLEQVLMNLCANARDAMAKGGELAILTDRVAIDQDFCLTHPWARPGEYVRLTVSDTGSGMDAAVMRKIFEPFFTTKELGRGTGLGLAVVYGIVKQHGGLIHVYSEPEKGTTFRIYFPFYAAVPETLDAEASGELVGGSETLLLAEDDDALRATATRLLEKLGYRVIAVSNGEEALAALETMGTAIQLVVLDVVMPVVGGRQVYEQLHGRYPDLRFVFTTGYSPGTSPAEPVRTLPAEVLSKPYGLQMLARTVRRALDAGDR